MIPVALAIDLGGTKVEAGLVTADGTVVASSRHRRPTGPDSSSGRHWLNCTLAAEKPTTGFLEFRDTLSMTVR